MKKFSEKLQRAFLKQLLSITFCENAAALFAAPLFAAAFYGNAAPLLAAAFYESAAA